MNRKQRALFSTVLMSAMATTAWAQGRGGPCTLGYELSYGISAMDCLQCTVRSDGNEHWTEYGAEPVVRAMFRAMTPIQPGDVLVAIDGKLITTAAGGRALSHPVAGQVAKFTVRRGGRQMDVNVMPGTPCPIVSAATAALVAKVAAASAGKAPLTGAARDSAIRASELARAQLRDSFELRYERDAFSRPYNVNLNGDTIKLGTIKWGRMEYLPEGRAIFITDSTGARQFRALNPVRSGGESRRDSTDARRQNTRIQWQAADKPTQTDTLPDGAVRTIWHEGRDTVFTIPNGGKAGAGIGAGHDTITGKFTDKIIVSSHSWLGFALDCRDCYSEIDATLIRQWRFSTFPTIAAIDPKGPAATAGIVTGDVLHSIDGTSIVTPAGATRFSVLKPGDRVRLTLDRNGRVIDAMLTVAPVVH